MRFTGYGETWLYSGTPDYALGTSLCYRRDWWAGHRFPALQIAEDGAFVKQAVLHGQFIAVDAGDLMYATTHDANTSPRTMSGSRWIKL